MHAAIAGKFDCVKLLIKEIQKRDKSGRTALIYALENKYYDISEILLDECLCEGPDGETALFSAVRVSAPIALI